MDNQIITLLNGFMIIKRRKQIRLKKYDYSDKGWYFVTICTQNRECLLGNVINGKMIFNKFGQIVNEKINELKKYKNINVDIYCVMPNHIHLILIIVGADPRVRLLSKYIDSLPNNNFGSTQGSTPTKNPSLGEYIKRLKTLTTYIYIENVKNNNWPKFQKRLWQRNYYEHIIRNEYSLFRIREYMRDNPMNWDEDRNNLSNQQPNGN